VRPATGLRTRQDVESEERERLAPWAMKSADSRGRRIDEPPHPYRTAFQRDRDRVIHSTAFRRLEYKTQVFVFHEGDHFRNRLTHTIEGGQIARSIARALRANEDLAEAVVLAHDLGHPPFGHAGERVLDELLAGEGGFDHNRQTLRIVDWLEERYPHGPGLNLTHETREGLCKHGTDWPHPVPVPPLAAHPTLEAQIADRADETAYVNHDLDDGLRSGLLDHALLEKAPLWCEVAAEVAARMPGASERVKRAQTVGGLINRLVVDLVEATAARIERAGLASPDAVRAHDERVVAFSPAVGQAFRELKAFLFEHLYDHPRVADVNRRAEEVLSELYRRWIAEPSLLPSSVREHFEREGEARAIADYIAGMTDRFAQSEHRRLARPGPEARGEGLEGGVHA
jgi:dGTPase